MSTDNNIHSECELCINLNFWNNRERYESPAHCNLCHETSKEGHKAPCIDFLPVPPMMDGSKW